MAVKLSAGAVERMCKGDTEIKPVLQVTEIRLVANSTQNPENDRYRMVVSDGTFILIGMLVTQRNDLVLSGKLQKGSIVKLAQFACNRIQGRTLIIVIDLEVICEMCYPIGQPTGYIPLPGGARPVRVQSLVAGLEAETEEFAGAMMKLTYSNYSIWKSRMEDLLYCRDLYDPIKLGSAKPAEISDSDWEKLHRKAVGTIRQWVDNDFYHHISNETDAQILWKKLESMYERKSVHSKAFAIKRLVNLKYKDGKPIAEHLSEFQELISQLSTMRLVLDDELQALLLLSSLPDNWETLVVTLSNSTPSGVVSLPGVKDSIYNEETRRKYKGTSNELSSGHNFRSKVQKKKQKKGHDWYL